MSFQCILLTCALVAQNNALPESYVDRAALVVSACTQDLPSMQAPAEAAAQRLAAGGKLWATGQPSWVSELSGRAGGIMLLQNLGDAVPAAGDVVLFAQADGVSLPPAVRDSGALLVYFGGQRPEGNAAWFPNHAEAGDISPTLANIIPGWLFCSELVGALTRLGKMPVIFETIGLPGGFPRIYAYQAKGIFWHETHSVPAIAPGVLGKRFGDGVLALLKRVEKEDRAALDTAGAWAAQAKNDGHRVIMYSMGHFPPDEIAKGEIGTLFESGTWNSGFTSSAPPSDTYAEGDVIIHIGYQHPPYGLFEKARPVGARVVYVDILRHRDYVHDEGVLWIDPMWLWPDAIVTIEGYDIPAMPPSGIVNTAIAWEIFRLAKLRMTQ